MQLGRRTPLEEFEQDVLSHFRSGIVPIARSQRLGNDAIRFYFSRPGDQGEEEPRSMYLDMKPGFRVGFGDQSFNTHEVLTDRGTSGWIGTGQLLVGEKDYQFQSPLDTHLN